MFFHSSNVHGRSADPAQGPRSAVPVPPVSENSVHTVWPLQAVRPRHVGLGPPSVDRVHRPPGPRNVCARRGLKELIYFLQRKVCDCDVREERSDALFLLV